jgi:hypothetical protein
MAEWEAAFAAGSTDPQTANRLTMHLVREKRDTEATAVLEEALTRGLPANVEETLRKRLETLRHRGEPKAAKRDVPVFSVRHGEHFLQLVSQERLSPPAGVLASSGDVAIVTGITKGVLTMTRVNLGTGERSTVTGLPVFSNLHVTAKGWAIAEQRLGRIGEGPATLLFLDPEGVVRSTQVIGDAVSEIAELEQHWYVGSRCGTLQCFDREGNELWSWLTPGATEYDDENPYFRPCPYFVSATERLVLAASMGQLFGFGPGGELHWQREVPNEGPLTVTMPLASGPTADAWQVLGVPAGAPDADVKQAYRRLVLDTHPDRHPDDPTAAEEFRRIQAAYEQVLAGHADAERSVTITITTSMTPLVAGIWAAKGVLYASSNDGVLSRLDAQGRVLVRRQLGRTAPRVVLDPEGTLVAAVCSDALYFFDGDDIVNATDAEGLIGDVQCWGEHLVATRSNRLSVFDRRGTLLAELEFSKRIAGAVPRGDRLLVVAGALVTLERC